MPTANRNEVLSLRWGCQEGINFLGINLPLNENFGKTVHEAWPAGDWKSVLTCRRFGGFRGGPEGS